MSFWERLNEHIFGQSRPKARGDVPPTSTPTARPERKMPASSEAAPVEAVRWVPKTAAADFDGLAENSHPSVTNDVALATGAGRKDGETLSDEKPEPGDPLLTEIVQNETVSVRLTNAILNASQSGTLPFERVSAYRAAIETAPAIMMRNVQNLGAKSASELDALIRQLPQSGQGQGSEQPPITLGQLRAALGKLFAAQSVEQALSFHSFPVRLESALRLTGLYDEQLDVLLLSYADRIPELRGLPNVGRTSVAAGRKVLGKIVTEGLAERGFTPQQAAIGTTMLLDRAAPDAADQRLVTEALERLTRIPVEANTDEVSGEPPGSSDTDTPAEIIERALKTLDDRSRDIIIRRFGLGGCVETLEQVGAVYGVTRERIRQIEARSIRRLRHQIMPALKRAVLVHGDEAWRCLCHGAIVTQADLGAGKRRLPGAFVLALELSQLSLADWLSEYGQRLHAGWLPPGVDVGGFAEVIARYGVKIAPSEPIAVANFAPNHDPSLVIAALSLAGGQWYGSYLVQNKPRRRTRRTIGLHSLLASSGGPMAIDGLTRTYRRAVASDPCSVRDAEIVMAGNKSLFVEVLDGLWSAVGRGGDLPVDQPDEEPETQDIEEVPTDSDLGTIRGALEAELRRCGPLRISDLMDRAADILPEGRSALSIGPILITHKDSFTRLLPGLFALNTQVLSPAVLHHRRPSYLFEEEQVRTYIFARRCGEPWGSYPYWLPETESLWSAWARKHADTPVLESLLSVIDPSVWPLTDDGLDWTSLSQDRGRFMIGFQPNPDAVVRPPLIRLFAACVLVRSRGGLGWIGANRVLMRRVGDHGAAGLLALLVALGGLAPAADWQAAHSAGTKLSWLIDRLENELSATGALSWDSPLGQELMREARSAEPGWGWVTSQTIAALIEPSNPVPAPTSHMSILDQLLSEQAERDEEDGFEAAVGTERTV